MTVDSKPQPPDRSRFQNDTGLDTVNTTKTLGLENKDMAFQPDKLATSAEAGEATAKNGNNFGVSPFDQGDSNIVKAEH